MNERVYTPVIEPKPDDNRKTTSSENGKKGGRPSSPPHAETADRYANDRLKKGGKFIVHHHLGEWLKFDESSGWKHMPDAEMEADLVTYLRADNDLRPFATISYARSVLLNLRAHDLCGLPSSVEMPTFLSTGESARNWIAFKNKIVDIRKYAQACADGVEPKNYIKPITPDFFSLDFVPYEWNPIAPTPMFDAYLERVQPDPDMQAIIRRMLGLLMTDITRYEVFFQLYGYGCNGKTVILDVLTGLVGAHNVSTVDLGSIAERFQTWPLAVSKINVCGELPTDMGSGSYHAIEGALKNCVSGGLIEFEKKGRDKYTSTCKARFVMASNSLPTFVDKSEGVWRRLRVVPFFEEIQDGEKDVNLAAKICASELSGIAGWALRGLAEVFRTGYFEECAAGLEMKKRHRLDCDHEKQFLHENYIIGCVSDRIKGADIYSAYSGWMLSNGYRPCGASKFYARVENVFPGLRLKMTRIMNSPCKGFEGLLACSTDGVNDVL